MLSAVRVSRHHGAHVVLDDVSLSVGPGSRIGIVGPNGIGKSTLLRVLAGLEPPDGGTVERAPAGLAVGYLPQEPDAVPGETLAGFLARRTGVAAASAELDRWTATLAESSDETTLHAYSAVLDAFLHLGGDDLDARIGQVLADVGLAGDRVDVAMSALSGGQAAKAGLAAILLARFDVFLLDEPTNNLDFAGLDRLERFLDALPGGVVVVSHDRAFLDRSVTRVVELEEERHRAREFAGGWSDFVAARALARRQGYEAYEKYVARRASITDRIQTQKLWAIKGVKAAKSKATDRDKFVKHFRAAGSEKQAAKVKISEKRLERLEAVDKPWEGWQLKMSLSPAARSGDVVARLQQAVVPRGSFTLGPIGLEIAWQDRIAILGPNGSGKTTLLRALLGQAPLRSGTRWLGPGVVVGELDQARHGLAAGTVVVDAVMAATGLRLDEARSLLAKFGLGAEHALRPGGELSPGERSRAILATLMAQGVNCLVLDEPTNHLDLAAIEQLEDALESYDGTLLLVTHDRAMLEEVRITRTIELGAT
ncbi:MAG: transporter related [Acidimicrobiales bacterium]|nr:transporter related [Acidimicrobiales bacterium]